MNPNKIQFLTGREYYIVTPAEFDNSDTSFKGARSWSIEKVTFEDYYDAEKLAIAAAYSFVYETKEQAIEACKQKEAECERLINLLTTLIDDYYEFIESDI